MALRACTTCLDEEYNVNYKLILSLRIEEMLMKRTLKYCALMLGDLLILLVGVMPALAKDRVKLNKTKVNMYVGG